MKPFTPYSRKASTLMAALCGMGPATTRVAMSRPAAPNFPYIQSTGSFALSVQFCGGRVHLSYHIRKETPRK